MAGKKGVEVERGGEGCCGLTACKYTLCVFNFVFLVSQSLNYIILVVYYLYSSGPNNYLKQQQSDASLLFRCH